MYTRWYTYSLNNNEIAVLKKSEVGLSVLQYQKICEEMRKHMFRVRCGGTAVIALITLLIPMLNDQDYGWQIFTMAFFASLIFYGWSWFTISEENEIVVKEATLAVRKIADEKPDNDPEKVIIEKMFAESPLL